MKQIMQLSIVVVAVFGDIRSRRRRPVPDKIHPPDRALRTGGGTDIVSRVVKAGNLKLGN